MHLRLFSGMVVFWLFGVISGGFFFAFCFLRAYSYRASLIIPLGIVFRSRHFHIINNGHFGKVSIRGGFLGCVSF